MSTVKEYHYSLEVLEAIKYIEMEDLESLKYCVSILEEDLNNFPIFVSDSKVLVNMRDAQNGYVGFCSILDCLVYNSLINTENNAYSSSIEYLFSLEKIDHSKLVATTKLVTRRRDFYLLDLIASNNKSLFDSVADYTSTYRGRYPGVIFTAIDYIFDNIISDLDERSFEFIGGVAKSNPHDIIEQKSVISYLSDGFAPEDDSENSPDFHERLVQLIFQILLSHAEEISASHQYHFFRALLEGIQDELSWNNHFNELLSIIPNHLFFDSVIESYLSNKMYNFVDLLIKHCKEIKSPLDVMNSLKDRNTKSLYLGYLIWTKRDFTLFSANFMHEAKLHDNYYNYISIFEKALRRYLVAKYTKKEFKFIKSIITDNDVELCFLTGFLEELIIERDMQGVKFILPNYKRIQSELDSNSIEYLLTVVNTNGKTSNSIRKHIRNVSKKPILIVAKDKAINISRNIQYKRQLKKEYNQRWN